MKQIKSQAKTQKSNTVKSQTSSISDTMMNTPLMQLKAQEQNTAFGSGVVQMERYHGGESTTSDTSNDNDNYDSDTV